MPRPVGEARKRLSSARSGRCCEGAERGPGSQALPAVDVKDVLPGDDPTALAAGCRNGVSRFRRCAQVSWNDGWSDTVPTVLLSLDTLL